MDRSSALVLAIAGAILLIAISLGDDEHAQECPDGSCPYELVEALADIPPMLRQPNWSPYGYGSCVHASTCTLLQWQGQFDLAKWWKSTYNSGEYASRLIKRMEDANLRYAYTDAGDVRFLEWSTRNRLGAGVFYYYKHAVNLVELNSREAVLIDNNRPDVYIRIPRDEFIHNWRTRYHGFAWTVVYGAPPPYPTWN